MLEFRIATRSAFLNPISSLSGVVGACLVAAGIAKIGLVMIGLSVLYILLSGLRGVWLSRSSPVIIVRDIDSLGDIRESTILAYLRTDPDVRCVARPSQARVDDIYTQAPVVDLMILCGEAEIATVPSVPVHMLARRTALTSSLPMMVGSEKSRAVLGGKEGRFEGAFNATYVGSRISLDPPESSSDYAPVAINQYLMLARILFA